MSQRRDVRDSEPFNFTLKMTKDRIDTKIPIKKFEAKDTETGDIIKDKFGKATYATLPEYLATKNHTIKRFSDTHFVKGLEFTYKELKEMESELLKQGLVEGRDYWFLSHSELREELAKDEWNPKETIKEK